MTEGSDLGESFSFVLSWEIVFSVPLKSLYQIQDLDTVLLF